MNGIVITLAKVAILIALNQPEYFNLENALKAYPAPEKEGAIFVTCINPQHIALFIG